MGDIEEKLQRLLEQQQYLQQQLEQQKPQKYRCSVKLPELEIPTFDGDRLQWAEFWNFFQVTVDQNTQLSDVEKFCYLKSRLTGEAKDAISGILISQENYGVIKTLLEDRFNNAEVVQHHHIMELINITPACNNSNSLRLLYNKLEWHFRCLEALQQDINHGIIMYIMKSKIPQDVFLQLDIQTGTQNKWSVKRLRESLNNYIHAMETVEQLSCSGKTEDTNGPLCRSSSNKPRSPQSQSSYQHYILQCRYCNGNHWNDQCVEFPTAEDRRNKIRDSCYLCLKKGHTAFKCQRNKQCVYCGHLSHHHRSLCPKKFPKFISSRLTDSGPQQNMRNPSMIINKKEQDCDTARNIDKGRRGTDTEQQIDGEDVVHKQLVKVKSEMSELKIMMLDIKEELQTLRLENKGLEIQLKQISASNDKEYKGSEKELESTNIQSHTISEQENNCMQRTDLHGEVDNKFNMNQDIENQKTKLSFEVYKYSREALLNFRDKLHFSQQITKRQYRDIPLRWECRGNPRFLP